MHIERLDHLVLTVRSIQATCDFYARTWGLAAVTVGNDRQALQFGQQKIDRHKADKAHGVRRSYHQHGLRQSESPPLALESRTLALTVVES